MDVKAFVIEKGADGAGWLKTDKLPIDPALRKACEVNTCGSFGKTYACPPLAGTTAEVEARARSYEDFLLFQTIGKIKDSFDVEGMDEVGKRHNALTRAVHDALYKDVPGILMLGAGGCSLCETCVGAGGACKFPERVIPSMSAYCIQVSKAAALAGLKYNNGADTVTFFSGIFVPKGLA